MSNCVHGYPEEWRRHCVECDHAEDIAELNAEIERLQTELEDERSMTDALRADLEGIGEDLEGALERGMSRKYTLEQIGYVSMSMFSEPEDMIRWIKRIARREYDKFDDTEVNANATEEEGYGPEGAD